MFCVPINPIFRRIFLGGRRPQPEPHFSELPNEMLLIVFRRLPVVDRLRCEGVNRRWNELMWKHGWNGDKKLDKDFVFGGASERQTRNFDHESLITFFRRLGPCMIELDLGSFGNQIQPFLPQISDSLYLLRKLEKLNIEDLDLELFLDVLPGNLRELQTNGPFSDQALEKIAEKCPALNSIRFSRFSNVSSSKYNAFFEQYTMLKLLHLRFVSTYNGGNEEGPFKLPQMGELEELILTPFAFQNLGGVAVDFPRLRNFELSTMNLSSEELLKLAKFPCLEELTVHDRSGKFTDSVLMAITRRGQLKGLSIRTAFRTALTNTSIFYLIGKCKSLVSLSFDGCLGISVRSVEAVVAEVSRRHGDRLPTGLSDPRIFTFEHRLSGINGQKAREMTENNPWIRLNEI